MRGLIPARPRVATGPGDHGGPNRYACWWRWLLGQPVWLRPTLAALTAIAGFAYAWRATGNLEIYYAAAARSMSMSWHDFLFASFDPAGTVTVDKLPGALWLQALSVRVFGVHAWALVAPQVVEGMASVLVLFRVVRRLSGAAAGLLAALVFVLSPATVALNRGNVPDTLMILLLLLAADATVRAVIGGRNRSLLWAAVLVGFAFQAKMLEAWLILPALTLGYLAAVRTGWRQSSLRLAFGGVVVAAVSFSWMLLVTVWPAGDRPYIDGSHNDSIFSQVFVYNGFGRFDQSSPDQLLSKSTGLHLSPPATGWNALFTGALGRDTGWLIPVALIALVVCVTLGRDDRLLRAATALWGTWLVVLLIVFSASHAINSYYTGALTPPIAGLVGTALVLGWRRRTSRQSHLIGAAAVACSCGYAAWLLPATGFGTVAGLRATVIALSAAAVILLLIARGPKIRMKVPEAAVALSAAALLVVPAAASASIVTNALGPFDTPFESRADWNVARGLGAISQQTQKLIPPLKQAAGSQPDLMATQTSAVAAPFIYDTGDEIVPIGGFTGTIPEPTLGALKRMIARGDFKIVIQAKTGTDPRLRWIASNCRLLPSTAQANAQFALYYCM